MEHEPNIGHLVDLVSLQYVAHPTTTLLPMLNKLLPIFCFTKKLFACLLITYSNALQLICQLNDLIVQVKS